jgi:serine protease
VLGKCGGYDSDIMAAMLWAAGEAVGGVPANPNPARIINMSLGASGPCPQSYSDIITDLSAKGVLVVVSAGNLGGTVEAPANCQGVAAIGGLRHAGTKVGFSSLGPEITVSAPAGNCINTVGTCVYSLQTTTNSGSTTPVAGDDAYTGTGITVGAEVPLGPNLGTSFSAPIVSGIAGLMISVNGNLTTCQLISRLKEGAVAFPQTSPTQPAPPMCHVPTGTSDVQNLECICTLDGKTCGAGMVNAKGAVQAALRPIAAVSLPSAVSTGQPVTLNAQSSGAANRHTISSYLWTSVGNQTIPIQNGTSPTATVVAPSCGLATVRLAVTDDAGRVDTADIVLDPTSVSSEAPADATNKSCTIDVPRVRVQICPAATSVQAGGTQALTATVANTTDASVTWQVEGIAGGNATVGTISSSGVYTAPAQVPSSSQVTVTAVSNADQTVMGSAGLTITAPPGSHGGGGTMDLLTLLGEALALSVALAVRRLRGVAGARAWCYARRCAASNHDFCARR